MPIVTPQDLITFSLKATGVIGVGQTALAEDNADAFSALNGMLAQWNRKRWLIWHLIDVAFVTTGAQSYSVGPGGNFNTPRPDRLEAAFFRQIVNDFPDQVDYPLTILEAREDYNTIALKTLGSWPRWIFYDSAYSQATTPSFCGFVYPWPVPQASLYELHLSLKETLTQFTSYTQQINLPPEYTEALWTNLTIRLGAIYPGAQVTQSVQDLAKASLSTIRGANAQIPRLRMPNGLLSNDKYNIFSDQTYS